MKLDEVIGINLGHDAGIAHISSNGALSLVEAERETGIRHVCCTSSAAKVSMEKKFSSLLKSNDDVKIVGVSDYFSSALDVDPSLRSVIASPEWASRSFPHLSQMLRWLESKPIFSGCPDLVVQQTILVRHHWAHACLAHAMLGDEDALIIVLDGMANFGECGLIARSLAGKLEPIRSLSLFDGPRFGAIYEAAAKSIFGGQFDAGKLMGLAAFGSVDTTLCDVFRLIIAPSRVRDCNPGMFAPIDPRDLANVYVSSNGSDWQSGDNDDLGDTVVFPKSLQETNFFPRFMRAGEGASYPIADATIAATVQEAFEIEMCAFVSSLANSFPEAKVISLVGGCALNINANRRLAQHLLPRSLMIPSCCDDSGIALGVAFAAASAQDLLQSSNSQLDIAYSGARLKGSPRSGGNIFTTSDEFIDHALELLRGGRVVGWIEGNMEAGPRALGHRSIIANPFSVGIRKLVSEDIKGREPFRPVAMVCRQSVAHRFFKSPCEETPTMLFSWQVRNSFRDLFCNVLHEDSSMRIQTISDLDRSLLGQLLDRLDTKDTPGFLINTSLNPAGRPILNDVSAMLSFLETSELTALFFADEMVTHGVGV